MKYLKKFENHSAYEAAESGLILPNVSLCSQEHEVHYNASSPTPSHEYIEIGGIKWATMNIGANSVTDAGLYFAWGDTQGYTASQVGSGEGQKYFGWEDYKYGNGGSSASDMTKYNATDGLVTLQSSDDAVTVAWGGNWRMPTASEWESLGTAATSAWTNDYQGSGVSGITITDNSDSSKVLFFPAAGSLYDGKTHYIGSGGRYWSSSLDTVAGKNNADFMYFYNYTLHWKEINSRYQAFTIRGILDE